MAANNLNPNLSRISSNIPALKAFASLNLAFITIALLIVPFLKFGSWAIFGMVGVLPEYLFYGGLLYALLTTNKLRTASLILMFILIFFGLVLLASLIALASKPVQGMLSVIFAGGWLVWTYFVKKQVDAYR